ncbi:hypothetical protein DN069_37405 [Streptacidiphilus pinicola]|uniref:SnoaL-like domain-containing protein n=1 Tax=Streptacidiphilus pinicola TaxID=2219663 RepID=A0A2X0I7K7_9ACTN|nr:hypothetical protein DN069_37405 [Streptacidiphilus pinicola]
MNAWTLAAALLIVLGIGPCIAVAGRGDPLQRLVGASLASAVLVRVLLLLAQGFGRSSYVDVALVLAVLAPAGTLAFTRLLGEDARVAMPAQTPAELQAFFQQAVNDGAVDALVALYEPEPAFATRNGDPAVGGAALRAHLTGLLAARPHFDKVTTTMVFETGDMTCSDWSATAMDPQGATFAMAGHGTEVARRQRDGTWLLAIDKPVGYPVTDADADADADASVDVVRRCTDRINAHDWDAVAPSPSSRSARRCATASGGPTPTCTWTWNGSPPTATESPRGATALEPTAQPGCCPRPWAGSPVKPWRRPEGGGARRAR